MNFQDRGKLYCLRRKVFDKRNFLKTRVLPRNVFKTRKTAVNCLPSWHIMSVGFMIYYLISFDIIWYFLYYFILFDIIWYYLISFDIIWCMYVSGFYDILFDVYMSVGHVVGHKVASNVFSLPPVPPVYNTLTVQHYYENQSTTH